MGPTSHMNQHRRGVLAKRFTKSTCFLFWCRDEYVRLIGGWMHDYFIREELHTPRCQLESQQLPNSKLLGRLLLCRFSSTRSRRQPRRQLRKPSLTPNSASLTACYRTISAVTVIFNVTWLAVLRYTSSRGIARRCSHALMAAPISS